MRLFKHAFFNGGALGQGFLRHDRCHCVEKLRPNQRISELAVCEALGISRSPVREGLRMLERDEYVQLACDFLERLPRELVIDRLNGDAPPDYLVAPLWCLDKPALLRAIHEELERRDSWQGKNRK